MIIILEGPDGSGKTTLAKQLQARYSLKYHHEGPPPTDIKALDHYGAVLDNLRQENVVIDRFALGERVYGPILRGSDTLGADGWHVFQRLTRATLAIEILCLPSYETCRAAWASGRPELVKNEPQFHQIYEGWKRVSDRVDQYIYDYSLEYAWLRLCQFIDEHVLDDPLPTPYVGSPDATYLFVGERGADPTCKHNLPFFSTSNSSAYLNRALAEAGFKEDEFCLVNAYNHDGSPNKLQQFDITIPLGKVAVQAVLDARERRAIDTRLYEMPHPQYWKRFHASQFDRYVEMLRQCR